MRNKGLTLGAAFLMATSAIGPGFLTQTTVFTAQLGASFAFVILLSVLLDLGAQLNIWRIIVASGMRAPELATRVMPGLGHLLTLCIVFGGLAFNIGNVAGAGLGLEVFAGVPVKYGAAGSGLLAIILFMLKDAGRAMDWFARILGALMIGLTLYVAFTAHPPLVEVGYGMFWPEKIDFTAILTIVGGTVGGYISFAGAHRLLEGGMSGPGSVADATRSAGTGIAVATVMRLLLFLAAWGVVASGAAIDPVNPPASMFGIAAGALGARFFGLVMWSAAITSVVGSAFTSVSFLSSSFPKLGANKPLLYGVFISISVLVFALVGKPIKILLLAGAINGAILPVGLALLLLAARKTEWLQGYRLPVYWQIIGWLVVAGMGMLVFF